MKKRFFVFFLSLAFFIQIACGEDFFENAALYNGNVSLELASLDYFPSNPSYRCNLFFSLGKDSYSAGETIKTEYKITNMEQFPLVNSYLVIDVAKGGLKPANPPYASNTDNVIYEDIIRNISIEPFSGTEIPFSYKIVPFSYRIPEDMASGNYLLEAYLKTDRTDIIGLPHIMQSPAYKSFSVVGDGDFPYALISRTGTLFENQSGSAGVGVEPGESVEGMVSIIKDSKASGEIVLSVSVCEWDDSACVRPEDFYWRKDYPVISVLGNNSLTEEVSFAAPQKPGAYAIQLELKDSNGRTVSIYRSRIVVKGETALIRKMAVDRFHYAQNEPGNILLLIAPSPDNSTNQVPTDAQVSVSINSGGKTLYSASSAIPQLSGLSYKPAVFESFNFTAPEELKDFEVCAQIDSSQGSLYDKYCCEVDSSKFTSEYCGDGKCQAGENQSACCVDCGCAAGKECRDNICMTGPEPTVETTTSTIFEAQKPPVKTEVKDTHFNYYPILVLLVVLLAIAFVLKMKGRKKEVSE